MAAVPNLVDARCTPARLLGDILVERGLLTAVAVQRLVKHARSKNVRFGELVETMGMVESEELAEALATQHHCRKILQFAHHSFPAALLRTIPFATAVKHAIFPLKREGDKLALAVADPTTHSLFAAIASVLNVEVVAFVSTRSEINLAIARHYLNSSRPGPERTRILVVEDDDAVRLNVAKTLTRHGYHVETAVDAIDAFKKIFTLRPKLVVTDKAMPKLGPVDFLIGIREVPEFRYMPVMLMTAAATPDEQKEALERGFFDLILKPIREVGLLTRVSRALQSSEYLYRNAG